MDLHFLIVQLNEAVNGATQSQIKLDTEVKITESGPEPKKISSFFKHKAFEREREREREREN